jgi:hypothetical protein
VKLSVEEFHQELVDDLLKYLPGGDLEIIEMSILRLKVRFYIAVSFFVDIFYAVRTQKVSFAVVQKGKRIFGIDNLGGWHSHPFGKSEEHVKIPEQSIESIVIECSRIIKELDKESKTEQNVNNSLV